ncbi:NADPH:quinone reductase-like Zn-dependent oxidoreductase [Thermocatellispora tengchongensis]|uniref:NADPH:quinone reductase-like Zn-dependent oxidoreductase n=1 Tax=Thermocatellispora tengchongensis TaxID=1073253 RepID=A0A840PW80_9ACTN|nr:NADP-dependent oxidoreductase [Thermocatellispora tengchongensis]MBB5140135.1 NADPH:quinone reductase-like Zn-dependent oxidoreductase [Thermocatellispora tengchongensis]
MRAAAFTEFGPPEVLRVMEVETPRAGAGQVRVRVKAAGVQPYDTAIRSGWDFPGLPPFPRIPGNEFAGIVDEVGEGVTGVAPGDEVLGFTRLGCYAEYVVVPEDQVTPKPEGVPWEVAGGLTAGVQTAHLALDGMRVGEGDTVLIQGAAGSVGGMAVQIARRRGARVIGVAREDNHEYLRSLGATPVAYEDGGVVERVRALAPGGVDAALDGAGGAALDATLELVKDRDRIVTIVEHAKAPELGIRIVTGERSAARLAEYARLYAAGELRFLLRAAYPLDRAADAHRDMERGHGRGKIVITV